SIGMARCRSTQAIPVSMTFMCSAGAAHDRVRSAKQSKTMLKPLHLGSPFRNICRSILTASILPAAFATQAWAVDWNGPVTLNVNPTVGVGLVEGRVNGAAFDNTRPTLRTGQR